MLGLGWFDTYVGFRNIVIGACAIIFLVLWGRYAYEQCRGASDNAIKKKISQRTDRVEVVSYDIDGQRVRYVDIGNPDGAMLIFFHGAPGGISTWYNLIKHTSLDKTYRIIILDRPGYGKSGRKAITSLEKQARFSAPLLELNTHSQQPILIGHSLGPAVVAKMAVIYPEKIGGLIMIAGALAAEHEIIWLASYPFYSKLTKRLVPPPLRSTIYEKLTHKKELRALETQRSSITHPIIVMHGNADWIVPVENAYAVEDWAINAQLDMRIRPEWDHFLPFDRVHEVEKAILDMMDIITSSGATYSLQ